MAMGVATTTPRAGSRRARPSRIDRAGDPETGRAYAVHEDGRPGRGHVRGDGSEKAGDVTTGVRFLCVRDRRPPRSRCGWSSDAGSRALCVGGDPRGEWPAAAAAAQEAAGLARDTTQPQYGLTAELIGALVTALRGNEADSNQCG